MEDALNYSTVSYWENAVNESVFHTIRNCLDLFWMPSHFIKLIAKAHHDIYQACSTSTVGRLGRCLGSTESG